MHNEKTEALRDPFVRFSPFFPACAPFFYGANTTGAGAFFMGCASVFIALYLWRRRENFLHSFENKLYFLTGGAIVIYIFAQGFAGLALASSAALTANFPVFGAIRPYATFEFGLYFLTHLLWFLFILHQAKRPYFTDYFLSVIYVSIVIHAALAGFMYVNGIERVFWEKKTAYLGYATGGFVNRNAFALYLLIAIPIGMYFFIRRLKNAYDSSAGDLRIQIGALSQEIFGGAGFLLMSLSVLITVILLSGSRIAALSAVAITIFYCLRGIGFARRFGHRFAGALFGCAVIFGLVTALFYIAYAGESVFSRLHYFSDSAAERLAVYEIALRAFAAQPLTGYGAGAFEDLFNMFQSVTYVSENTKIWDKAHQAFLEILLALGGVFGAVFFVLCGLIIWRGVQIARFANRYRELGVCFSVASAAVFFQSQFDFSLQIPGNSFIYASLAAIAAAKTQSVLGAFGKRRETDSFLASGT